VAALTASPIGRVLDAPVFDFASTIDPPKPAADVVIVAIDEPSFAEIGRQWPWPRDLHARLATALKAAGARVVGLDMIFAEPSTPEADAALAGALGQEFVLASDETRIETAQASQTIRVEPLPKLLAGGASAGAATITLDPDGVLRRLPTVEGSFARALLAKADPTAKLGRTEGLIRFRGGPRTYTTVSYYQALDPQAFLPPGALEGTVALVGLSLQSAADVSAGAADAFATPFTTRDRRLLSGVEAQATLFDALRSQDLVAPFSLAAQIACVLAAALAGAAIGLGGVSWRGAAGAGICSIAIAAACWLAFRHGGVWLSPAPPALALLLTVASTAGLDYARERQARREIVRAFGQYLAPEVVERLAREPEALRLGGERRMLTVLFCDIRGFTELAERMKTDPERLTSLINRLLGPLSDAVLAEGGTIDKYIGDCVMAFWNAPLPVHDHAERAMRAGLAMLAAVERLNAELLAEAGAAVAPLEFAVGVGINSGECVVGNLGSERRFDYTAVGDAVNLASRLESASRLYGVSLLIGEDTAQALAAPLVELDRLAVKGRGDGVAVFTALPGSEGPARLSAFLSAYRAQRWDDAEAALNDVIQDEPRLALYAKMMADRVTGYREKPPPSEWTGVFAADRK
jgi:adenylate cyclase